MGDGDDNEGGYDEYVTSNGETDWAKWLEARK
jgi:hypothetical protein